MEISPIPGIRALPAAKTQQGDLRPPAILDIDASAKPGEGGGQKIGRKAAGAEENDEDDLLVEGEMEDGEALDEVQPQQVNYFA